jgi:hypothetical protein
MRRRSKKKKCVFGYHTYGGAGLWLGGRRGEVSPQVYGRAAASQPGRWARCRTSLVSRPEPTQRTAAGVGWNNCCSDPPRGFYADKEHPHLQHYRSAHANRQCTAERSC